MFRWIRYATFSALFLIQALEAQVEYAPLTLESFQANPLLPLNWTVTPKLNLEVTIPQTFTPIPSYTNWLLEDVSSIGFVPNGENNSNWTEIISINKFVGQQVQIALLMMLLKKEITIKTTNFKTLNETSKVESNYAYGGFIMSYDLEDKHEVMGIRYYAGPFECVGVQYTIRPQSGQTDAASAEKIEQFFNTHLKVK